MDAKSNVLTMYVVRGEQLSHPRAQQPDLSQHPSAAFSQINQQPLPIHHFATADNINPIDNALNTQDVLLQSINHTQQASGKSINNKQISVKLVKNKVEPANLTKNDQPDKPIQRSSDNPIANNSLSEDSQIKENSSASNNSTSSPKTSIDNQPQNPFTTSSSRFLDGNAFTNEKNIPASGETTSADKITNNLIRNNSRCQRIFLCISIIALVAVLLIGTLASLLVVFLAPSLAKTTSTTLPIDSLTDGSNTTLASTSAIPIITTTVFVTPAATTIGSTTSTTSTASTTTTTDTTTSTTTTTDTTTTTTSDTTTTTSDTTTTTSDTTTATSDTTTTTSDTTTTTSDTTTTTSDTTTTTSTTSTSTTTSTTTTASINPCSTGRYWNVNGVTYSGTGVAGAALNQLSFPTGLFFGSNDTMYIADSNNYRVLTYLVNGTTGTIVASIGVNGANLSEIAGGMRYIYVDANRSIYITDGGNSRVVRWASGASAGVMVAGNGVAGAGLNQINSPYSIWVDSSGNVYVTEYSNHRVTQWAPGATTAVVVAGITGQSGTTTNKLWNPTGLFYDEPNQNLYIVSGGAATIMRWRLGDSNGTIIGGTPGGPGASATQFNNPTYIMLDQWQNLYVNDRTNGRIQFFCNGSLTGITIAGAATGGTAFSSPYGFNLDSHLNLYVADCTGERVIKFAKL